MMKKLLFLGCFLSLFASLNAQTTLSAGDIAIIGVNYDKDPYELSIVTLVPIAANTQIYISDYWYNESTPNKLTNVQASTSNALASEGAILWQPTSAIAAGTVFKINITKGTNTVSGLPGTVSVTGWTDPLLTATPSNSGGENWFIYQGTSVTNVTNFVFLWGNAYTATINSFAITAGQFVTSGSGNLSHNSVTYLPPSLTLGTSAIAFTTVTYHGNNNKYKGIQSGTKAAILAEICDKTKWDVSETITYDITPGGTNFSGTNPIFTILSPNNAPTDITLSASAINENVAANSTVGTLSSTDVDSSSFTYTLVAGTGSTDNASFNISGSNLRITASPDFETKSSYSVRVRTSDGSLTFDKVFTITINNVNEAPTDIALSASAINENVAANSTVGTLSSTDVDSSSFTYTLVAGTGDTDNAAFTISGSDLKINVSPNFETKSSYSVRVRTSDGSLTFDKVFTITITNVNETPTDIALSASAINENVAANSTVGTLSSTDPDAASTFTYTLLAGTGDTDNTAFNISGSNLRITASPNFETKASYSVRVRTSDGSLTFDKIFTITINNVNEAPTDIALSASAINENVAANSTVGTLSSTDPDAASTFTYTLVAGTGDTDNSAFNISGSNLRITASPDFETKSSYSVRVRTSDGSLTFDKVFTITINNVNEAPTDIALSASAINENVAANSTVGTLSSTDVDSSSFTYTLVAGTGDTDNAAFTISGSNLRITASPDFETKSSYSIRVRTSDGSLTFDKVFTITINDLNEAPTDMAISASAINENVAANSTVGTLSSTDVDSSSFTYTLVAGTGSTDNASFNISGSNLRITASPNFETKASYSVRVRTSDGSLTFDKVFTITINNVNETPTDIALSASAINENVVANSTVGTLSSTDPDAASTFTYTLVAGTGDTDNAAFNISGSNLRITASPDFETKASYSVRVRTSDGSLTFDKVFTITINDLCDLNNLVTLTSGVLTATQTGATYQWHKCSDNSPVGTDSNTYTPTVIGDYKVDITVGGCTITSTCVTVSTLGTTDFETNAKLLIYPNPSKGIVNINSDTEDTFQITNQLGQTVKTFKVKANVLNTINVENLTDGIYFVKNSNNNKSYKLIIKK